MENIATHAGAQQVILWNIRKIFWPQEITFETRIELADFFATESLLSGKAATLCLSSPF